MSDGGGHDRPFGDTSASPASQSDYGSFYTAFEGSDLFPFAFLNADERGGTASNKPSLTIADAGAQITRGNLSWSTGGLGTAANVTFAFRSSAPVTLPTDVNGFTRFTETQINATLLALQAWADVANITFTRVADADGYSDNAAILFSDYATGQTGSAAFAYQPGNRGAASASGDVWVNYTGANLSPFLLNYGQHTLVHEIGHAIGLSHPAAYNAAEGVSITYGTDAIYYEDSRQYTVMSYFSEANTGASFRANTAQYSSVPLLDDIAAAQRLYGTNMTTRTGDTVYGFNSNADRAWFNAGSGSSLIFAVWDAGGTDTFDFSLYNQAQVIDLRQGAFSNVGGLVGNVAIAAGVVIENAIGGTGNDTIRGNSADNRLAGGGGDNTIDGGLGVDTAVFTGALSEYTIIWSGQTGVVTGNGQTTRVTNVEFLAFSDQTVAAAPTGGLFISGDLTNDTINGTTFTDSLMGGGGDDVLNGLGGADNLYGQAGNDSLYSGDGDDYLIGGLGDDLMDGGAGLDTADYLSATQGVRVNLASGVATGVGTDTLRNIEIVRGSNFADVLIGDGADNELRGSGGADVMYGGAGNDRFYSGVAGLSGGAPDVIKTAAGINVNRAQAIQLDGSFDLLPRTDVANAATTPHATVVATSGGSADWYGFSATAGVSIVIDIDNASFDSVIRIYNMNGEVLATNDDGSMPGDAGNETDSALTFTIPANGMYYVEVTEWQTNTPTLTTQNITAGATYTLHVSVPGHAVASTEQVGSTMYGEGGDDVFYQGVNVDTINMGSANDTMDGGDGVDTVVYNALSTDATITTVNGVTTVRTPYWGTDTLTGIERIQFNDRVVTLGVSDITGTAGADILIGTSSSENIFGLGGNDRITGGAGSDRIDGGEGFDTAVYSGVVRQYAHESTSISGGREGGTDTLISIEEAAFVDGRLSFDVNGNAAIVDRLYDATFDRGADDAGMAGWLKAMASGLTAQDIANEFSRSTEFTSRYAGTTNQQFVESMYRFSLGREGDAPGIAAWVNLLNANTLTRAQILLQFSESAEHRTQMAGDLSAGIFIQDEVTLGIARLYSAVLDRLPDVEGLAGWRTAAGAGVSLLDIARDFTQSAEFQSRFGALSNQAFVENLYRFTLDREGDAAGIAGWVSVLNSGISRERVVLEFSESPEHVRLMLPYTEGGVVYFGYSGGPQVQTAETLDKASGVDAALTSPVEAADALLPQTLPDVMDETGIKALSHDPFVLPAKADDLNLIPLQLNLADETDEAMAASFAPSLFGGQGDHALTLSDLPDAFILDPSAAWPRSHDHDIWR